MRGGWGLAAWCGALSLLWPGLGQVRARAWQAALGWLAIWMVTGTGATVVINGASARMVLPVLAAVVAGTGVVHVWAGVDAARRARRAGAAPRGRWWRSTWIAAVAWMALAFGASRAVPLTVMGRWRGFNLPSASNLPTLMVGDNVLADMRPMPGGPARGDMILFRVPGQGIWVKRVVAVAGDRVQLRGGRLLLNGVLALWTLEGRVTLEESGQTVQARRYRETLPGGRSYEILKEYDDGGLNDTPEWTVPAGRVFVLGDNRDASADSRIAVPGMVSVSAVVGRAAAIFWSRDWRRLFTTVR